MAVSEDGTTTSGYCAENTREICGVNYSPVGYSAISHDSVTRRNTFKLVKNFSRSLSVCKSSLKDKHVDYLKHVVNLSSVNSFKNNLETF